MKNEAGMSAVFKITEIICIVMLATVAQGADFTFHPVLSVGEEFTDNVFETDTGRVSDFITRGMPGLALAVNSPTLDADVKYLFDYRYYARGTHGTDTTHLLDANVRLKAVENLLFLDVIDQYKRVSLDVTRDVTKESLFLNQEDRNVLTVSPFVTLHLGQRAALNSGYRFIDTRYLDSSLTVDKTDHSAFLETTYELSPNWYTTGGYTFIHEENSIDNFNQHQPYAGFLYMYGGKSPAASKTPTTVRQVPFITSGNPLSSRGINGLDRDASFFFGQAGYTWIDYNSGNRLSTLYWNAGASHAFAAATVTVATGVRYDEDPQHNITQETFVAGGIEKELNKVLIGLSLYYSEFAQGTTDTLQTIKLGGIAHVGYEFTSRLNGHLAFTGENYDQRLLGSYTRRFLVDSGFGYVLAEGLTVSANYIFVDYFSPGIASDNKQINRVSLQVRRDF